MRKNRIVSCLILEGNSSLKEGTCWQMLGFGIFWRFFKNPTVAFGAAIGPESPLKMVTVFNSNLSLSPHFSLNRAILGRCKSAVTNAHLKFYSSTGNTCNGWRLPIADAVTITVNCN